MPRPAQDVATLDCEVCLDDAAYCLGPLHQFKTYYRDGQPDNCQEMLGKLKTCLYAKILKISDPAEAEKLVKKSPLGRPQVSPSATVWELKAKPSF